jgi:delta(3,5)-delta(2,4)-dienoyl-CoA isomerase
VICVLHGYCLGLAIDIACATDIRVCASDATFAVKEVDMGLAADIGTLSRLPKVVGSQSWVKDVCLSARPFPASEALAVGFVSAVEDGKDSALRRGFEIARSLAEKSPVAVQGTKALINYSVGRPTSDGLRYTQVWNSAALQASDIPIAMTAAAAAATQRKTPRFEKL